MTRRWSLTRWCAVVVEEFAAAHDNFKARDLKYAADLFESFFGYLESCGVTDLVAVTEVVVSPWIWGEGVRRDGSTELVAPNTARYRQLLVNFALEVAAKRGVAVDPVAVTGEWIPKHRSRPAPRALTDQEMQRVCEAAAPRNRTSQKPVLVALSRASGSAQDIPRVRVGDVDLDAGTVRFAGDSPRVCALDPDSAAAIAAYLDANPTAPDEPLCVKADTAPDRAEDSVTTRLWQILAAAGLGEHHDVTARSIRLTEAGRVLRNEGIAAAAKFLGSSLDATAEALDYQWRSHSGAAASDEVEDFGDG